MADPMVSTSAGELDSVRGAIYVKDGCSTSVSFGNIFGVKNTGCTKKKYTTLSGYCELQDLIFLLILFLLYRGCSNLNFELLYIKFENVVGELFQKN